MWTVLDKSWKDWIETNTANGCTKESIARTMFEHGFDPLEIVTQLRFLPQDVALVSAMNNKLMPRENFSGKSEVGVDEYLEFDNVTLSLATKVETDQLHMYQVENFLNQEECEALIDLIRRHYRPSTVTTSSVPDTFYRSSQTCDLGQLNHALVQDIWTRIAEYMGIDTSRAEYIQGQYYQVGNEFKAHTDYFQPDTPEYEQFAADLGQRTWTFLIYLNDVQEGGETVFTNVGVEMKPKMGKAVIWNSLYPDGSPNPDSIHQAMPLIQGEKFVITQWFRAKGRDPKASAFRKLPCKSIPVFTQDGFKKQLLPKGLYRDVLAFYQKGVQNKAFEQTDAIGMFIHSTTKQHPASMIELTLEMRQTLAEILQPLLEKWVSRKLKLSAIYGIREYHRGALLDMHVDRVETHQISAILNVAQTVDIDWPLQILDHKARMHEVFLKPGEVVFYESARLLHGRVKPLAGEVFANIFFHLMPA